MMVGRTTNCIASAVYICVVAGIGKPSKPRWRDGETIVSVRVNLRSPDLVVLNVPYSRAFEHVSYQPRIDEGQNIPRRSGR